MYGWTQWAQSRRVVIKLGTRVLTQGSNQIDTRRIASLSQQIAHLKAQGKEVLVVSSGAVGLGMGRLGLSQRPAELAGVQACAAVGQSVLTEVWQNAFSPHGITVAQVLLTRQDLQSRKRHLAVRNLLASLLAHGIVPIINENDALSADELKFGDNDILSALVASLVHAQALCILSTAPGLIDSKGLLVAKGSVIDRVETILPEHRSLAGGPGNVTSTGGMVTKLMAADIATRSGCGVVITSGLRAALLPELFSGNKPTFEATLFAAQPASMNARRRHLAFFEAPCGSLTIDAGATKGPLYSPRAAPP